LLIANCQLLIARIVKDLVRSRPETELTPATLPHIPGQINSEIPSLNESWLSIGRQFFASSPGLA
jgi:hypothetical protein